MNFQPFAAQVHANFVNMSKHELYTVAISGDDLYAAYLASFPAGTNPLFRVATEHECSTCRSFIKNLGNVVAIVDGMVHTVWDATGSVKLDEGYEVVAQTLADLIRMTPIESIFRADQKQYGQQVTKELVDSIPRAWHHFHGTLAAKHYTVSPGEARGKWDSDKQVFQRGLDELSMDALETVQELIASNNLYKGLENQKWLNAFINLRRQYDSLPANKKAHFVIANVHAEGARIRNSAIGQLLIDLSGVPSSATNDGKSPIDLEQAVKMHEDRVSGTNYQRPTALVTEGMKKKALETIQKLGLQDSLVRRLASPRDVSVNNVLWANAGSLSIMKDGIAGLMDSIKTKGSTCEASADKAKEVSVSEFLGMILPSAHEIKALVKGRHLSNMAAITAAVHADAPGLFKWDNTFAWTYTGNISDSIKERVKQAGGKTDAVLRVSLAWHNADDLDIHVYEPDRNHIYFGTRGRKSNNSGMLDVDMNGMDQRDDKNPVENVTWSNPGDGKYRVDVNNYNRRSTANVGFTVEVESAGNIQQFSSDQSPRSSGTINALVITIKDGVVTDIKADSAMRGESIAQTQWGITTNELVPVNMVMYSPNYWDDNATGNKHYFFMLEGCKTDEPLRGIMNEYLRGDLHESRKVFEVLGDKTKCQPTDDQLAGLGFSSTKGDSLTVQVTGKNGQRLYTIVF